MTEKTVTISRRKMRKFCNDILTCFAGIGWFNIDKEKDRAYKFIESLFPDIIEKRQKDR